MSACCRAGVLGEVALSRGVVHNYFELSCGYMCAHAYICLYKLLLAGQELV